MKLFCRNVFLGMAPILLLSAALAHAAAPLRSPWDAAKVKVTNAAYTCPQPETVTHDLTMDGFYRLDDPTHSIIDPVRQDAYTRAAKSVKGSGLAIVAAADAFRQTGSRSAGQCTVSLISSLVHQDSMTGKMSSNQSYYVQGWVAGAIGIAYLKVRGYGFSAAPDEAAMAAWLTRVATQTKAFYDVKGKNDGNRNNHFYWAGVEVAAIGIVANDRSNFDWGMHTYSDGTSRIRPDGTLPLEMERGARALHYHLYALAPLVLLAEFGEANGIDSYARDNGALHWLVKISVQGLVDPKFFETATGVKQDIAKQPSGDQIGWAPPYVRRFPDATLSKFIANASTLSVYYLGGLPPQ